MQFNHDNMIGVELAAALVNVDVLDEWDLQTVEDLLQAHRLRNTTLAPGELLALREWTRALGRAFSATMPEETCEAVNQLIGAGVGPAFLTMHDGLRPHLHFAADDDHIISRTKALTAGGLAIFTVEAEGRRLGVCSRGGCRIVFVDTSRNGARAFCSARCGNHEAVHRHRQRARAH